MTWRIEFVPQAAKELRKLDKAEAGRIITVLETRIATLDDPRELGAPLKGEHDGFWRWRVGDRIIARIEDESVLILVVRVAQASVAGLYNR